MLIEDRLVILTTSDTGKVPKIWVIMTQSLEMLEIMDLMTFLMKIKILDSIIDPQPHRMRQASIFSLLR